MRRREFLVASAAPLSGSSLSRLLTLTAPSSRPIDELSIAEMQRLLSSGQSSSVELTRSYLSRIAETNTRGPALRAVLETNPDAESASASLDAERKKRGARGVLHGIPLLIKDNIETADRMSTSAGSLALVGAPVLGDAPLVKRLRGAGAVILGKTNLSEWANFRSTRATSGWSARGGLTLNPYCLDRTPSGSSSGSGAAAAANLCAAAVGTETNGSIIAPSSANALVGLKPTVGLCSRTGIIPIAASQDTAGPMGRCVADVAVLLSAMAGPDPADAATQAAGRPAADYLKALDPGGLKGARLGVVRKLFGTVDLVNALMERAVDELKHLGAELVDLELPGGFDDAEQTVLLFEFKDGINRYLRERRPGAAVKDLAGLIEFNEREHAREMPFFAQELFDQAQSKGPLTSSEYLQARETCQRLTRGAGIDWALAEHRLDAMVTVAMGPPPVVDLLYGDAPEVPYGASESATSGYPSITVPMGQVWGLPTGILFVGARWSEATLLRLAYAYEQATHHRRPPTFATTQAITPGTIHP